MFNYNIWIYYYKKSSGVLSVIRFTGLLRPRFRVFGIILLLIGSVLSDSLVWENSNTTGEVNDQKIITFQKTFGGPRRDIAHSIQQTDDGGYIIVGESSSYGAGRTDVLLLKIDEYGNEQWNQTFGGANFDEGLSVQQVGNSGYIVTGVTHSFCDEWYDVWLIRTDKSGNELWNRTFGGIDGDQGIDVRQTVDGGFIVTGYTTFENDNSIDAYLIKTDKSGIEQWNRTFGGVDNDKAYSIDLANDGGFIITGFTWAYCIDEIDLWLIKVDSAGNEEWNKTYSNGYYDLGNSIQQTMDDGFIITGITSFSDNGSSNLWLIKTDNKGILKWSKIFFRNSIKSEGKAVRQTSDGGFIITGYKYDINLDDEEDICLIKTDESGNVEWEKIFSGSNEDIGHSVEQTDDGGYIFVGETVSYGAGSYDIWLIKTDDQGFVESKTSNNDEPEEPINDTWSNGSNEDKNDKGFIPNFESSLVILTIIFLAIFNERKKK